MFGTYFVLLVIFWQYFERSGFEGRSLPWEVGGAVLLGAACTAQRSHTGAVHFLALFFKNLIEFFFYIEIREMYIEAVFQIRDIFKFFGLVLSEGTFTTFFTDKMS